VTDFEIIDGDEYDVLCIDYKVQKLFDYGQCDRTLKKFILNKCSGGPKNDKKDMTGLIESCETTSGQSKSGKKFCVGNKKGITIKPKDQNFDFKLCLRNVFDDNYDFGDKVKFKTKVGSVKDNFLCSADYLSGLPCFDSNKFNSGDYDNSGFNAPQADNAQIGEEVAHNNELKTHSAIDSTVEWSLIGGVSAVVVCVVVVFGFCLYRKKKIGSNLTRNAIARDLGTSDNTNKEVVTSNGNETNSNAVILSTDQV